MWYFDCPYAQYHISVNIRGTMNEPDPARLMFVGQIAERLQLFVAEASGYLAEFVKKVGPCYPQEVTFGADPEDTSDTFDLVLIMDGDDYGYWKVKFSFAGEPLNCFFPNEFTRSQA